MTSMLQYLKKNHDTITFIRVISGSIKQGEWIFYL